MQVGKLFTVILCLALLAGCGSVSDQPKTVTPPAATESIKAVLNDLAQTGQMSSGVMTLETEIEKLRATDAAKADALKQGYDQLKGLNNPALIQAKAKEMLSKL
jgi:outer membrane murein-binding lipoprotein Lpp